MANVFIKITQVTDFKLCLLDCYTIYKMFVYFDRSLCIFLWSKSRRRKSDVASARLMGLSCQAEINLNKAWSSVY